ncbi:MAG: alpha/beta hydrolase-fold protein [Cyclobacteriaceae bacterium]
MNFKKHHLKKDICSIFMLWIVMMSGFPISLLAQEISILDQSHYSHVFGEFRNYRVFLPAGYQIFPDKKYPVIYYYHGWSQRYFGSIENFKADEGDSNGGDNIANFVANNEVIVVKPDGYNRTPGDVYDKRPYNISPVETYRQFPIYFPELVGHIDAQFRTLPNRENRAISGLSMGGFMAFWIGGKYPHLVSAIGNFCGSTEFFVGPREFPVEYRHEEMYKNYGGINLRLHFGDEDFIRAYHRDMNKVWTQVLDNYVYRIYEGGHATVGLGDMFGFLTDSFQNPPEKPTQWNHIDVYPTFSVWDYQVDTDRNLPGFTLLENVQMDGFQTSIRPHLPDGQPMSNFLIALKTAPIYDPHTDYQIFYFDHKTQSFSKESVKSNHEGRVKVAHNGGLKEVGILKKGENNPILRTHFKLEGKDWLTHHKEAELTSILINNGSGISKNITIGLESTQKDVVIMNQPSLIDSINPQKFLTSSIPFRFMVKDEKIEMVHFKVTIEDGVGNKWEDKLDLPIKSSGPEMDFTIADGKNFTVASGGIDTEEVYLGHGNGDGMANPGESIVLLVKEKGIFHRTLLKTNDGYINPEGINIRKSINWSKHDHVGASEKYNVPVISANTPQNHKVKFFAEYWLPDYPDHHIIRGEVTINISGTDTTPPMLEWMKMGSDNTLEAKFLDGGKVTSVMATLEATDESGRILKVSLHDNGLGGDVEKEDGVFTTKIPEKGFGIYSISITANDASGNGKEFQWPETMILH